MSDYAPLYLLTALPLFLTVNDVIVFPLHLLAMICLIYVLYFVAKSLVLTNKRRHVTLGDYAWSLFLLWVSPLGVWKFNHGLTSSMPRGKGTDTRNS